MASAHSKISWGISSSILSAIIIGVLTYSIRIILARELTLSDYGFIYAAFSLFTTFEALFDFGIGASGTILMAQQKTSKKLNSIYSTFFITRVIISLICLIGFSIISEKLSCDYFNKPNESTCISILAIWLSFIIIAGGNFITLDILKDYTVRNLLQILPYFIIASILLTYKPITTTTVAISYAIGVITSCIMLEFRMVNQHKMFPKISWQKYRENFKEIIHFSKWVAVSTAGITLMFNMDSLMLVKLKGLNDVGLYNGALPIIQIPLTILAFVPKVFIPHIANLTNKTTKEIQSTIKRYQLFIFIPCLLGLFLGYFLIDDIIVLLFKEKFAVASTAAFILCCGVPFYAMALIDIGYLQSTNRQKQVAIIIMLGLLENLVCNYLLIPRFGINGAASATLTTYVSIFLSVKLLSLLNKNT